MAENISHSRVESYLTCRRKDWYGYQYPTKEGTGIRRIDQSGSLGVGSAFHRIAAAFYQAILAEQDKVTAWAEAWAVYDKIMEDGFENRGGNYADLDEIVRRFLDNESLSDEYEILAVEKEFNLVSDEGGYPFVVDLIVRHRVTGLMYVVDHKTGYNLYTSDQTDLMPQIPKYLGALRALGYNVVSGIYQVVRTQKIAGKVLTKDELVNALKEKGHEWSKPPIVARLQEIAEAEGIQTRTGITPAQAYQVLPVEPSNTRIEQTMREQFETAQELRERDEWDADRQEARAWRTANNTVCKGCQFRLLCNEELRGGNVKLVLMHEYEPKPKRDGIEASEEIDDE